MTKRIQEAGTIVLDPATDGFRVCLISEGSGSSADYPRSFFIQENADALGGSLSFPGHPVDIEKPHMRNPLSAIGSISDVVTIEEHEGRMGFWSRYIPDKSKPELVPYLKQYGPKLGLSVFADSDGHNDPNTGKWVAESLDAGDPYKSVDLVVAAGARGRFQQLSESLGLIEKTSATAEEKQEIDNNMEKIEEVARDLGTLSKTVEGLVERLDGQHKADSQVQADETAVKTKVKEAMENYDKALDLISKSKLTESQKTSLRALATSGAPLADIQSGIDAATKIIEELRGELGVNELEDGDDKDSFRMVEHLSSEDHGSKFSLASTPSTFGRVG